MTLELPSIETTIAINLLFNENFSRSVAPYLKTEFFEERPVRIIYDEYSQYIKKYNSIPSKEALYLEIETRTDIDQDDVSNIKGKLAEISKFQDQEPPDETWLKETTEKYCKDRAVYLAITEAIGILDNDDGKKDKNAIPGILSDALAVSFDEYIGHDYYNSAAARWDFNHTKEAKFPFDLKWLNEISGGGLTPKTLTCLMAGTGVGKSMVMCHMAGAYATAGKNVLYITMEMAEERISERIDANLLDTDLDDLEAIPKKLFVKRIDDLRDKTVGKFYVKEYPTCSAHVGHFRHLLNELKLKKKFKPDIIFVDYLNICASSRIRNSENTYVLIKGIAEELRGLAVEQNVAIVTATQTNRGQNNTADIQTTDTSESFGTVMSLDLMIGIVATDELNSMGQIMMKCLKTRFADLAKLRPGIFKVDRPKMRLSEIENNGSTVINQGTITTQAVQQEVKKNPFDGFEI